MMEGNKQLGEMDLDEFRKQGHRLVDWIADYLGHPENYPVLSRVEPGEVKSRLPASPPIEPERFDDILKDFEETILPGITHWNHPGFYGYFGITGSGPGILGEMLSAALNVNAMLWRTSPSATELEEVTLDWLRQMLGLPESFHGMIVDTASISSMLALVAAREALNLDIRQKGTAGRRDVPRLRLYVSTQTHSSIEKGAITIGLGQESVRHVPVDDAYRMDAQVLEEAILEDIASGWRPFCAAATVGTTSTTSIDPVSDIAVICRRYGLWLHVDGAYGGAAAILPEMRHVLAGVEKADSFVVNPHKWLFTPIDCSAFYVRNPEIFKRAFSLVPDYLKTSEEGVTNYMDWGVQLGRRFRALKLWFIIRHFGQSGLASRIREHIRLGQQMAEWIDEHPDFERLAPTPFSTVCFRACPAELQDLLASGDQETRAGVEEYLEQLNTALIDAVNKSGEVFFAPTRLNDRYTVRMAISNIRSDESAVTIAWEMLQQNARQIDAGNRAKWLVL